MILTVTPNPALDLTWHVDALSVGDTHRVLAGQSRAGGKGLNVARVLASRGVSVTALAPLGGEVGREFVDEARDAGLDLRTVPLANSETRRSVAIVDRASSSATVLNEWGPTLSVAETDALVAQTHALARQAEAVAISGSMPPGLGEEALVRLIEAARASRHGVLVDTSGQALLTAAQAGARILKPNEHELAEATGTTDPQAGAEVLLSRGAHLVVVSLGERGLMMVHRDGRVLHAHLSHIVAGNATGAGDAVSSALVAALATDPHLSDLEGLARRATAWGAAAVAMPLAGELSSDADEWEALVTITVKDTDDPRQDH